MIAASLMWAGAAEKPEQSKMTFKNHRNDSKQLTQLPKKSNQNQIENTKDKKICYQTAQVGPMGTT